MREQMTLNEAESKDIDKAAQAFMTGCRPHLHVRAQLNLQWDPYQPATVRTGDEFSSM